MVSGSPVRGSSMPALAPEVMTSRRAEEAVAAVPLGPGGGGGALGAAGCMAAGALGKGDAAWPSVGIRRARWPKRSERRA